jgi:AraC-like DNA-binding protein
MVRVFAGPHWQPAEIGLMTRRAPCLYIREQFWAARIRLSQPYSYITLENSLLSQPPLADESDAHASSPIQCKPLPDDFVGSLKHVLHAYIKEGDLNIELAAALGNTSKRSLQRKLSETGTHYSIVRDEVRFDVARKMLLDPNMKVTDVAHYLGYSDSAHFSRAFRRIAGVNPREYCQQYQH